ncbi:YlcI/YnfO family protein [Demequina sediminicola]|uniref:YlcI/YnfO family protein n=1 Tax=Demequina sediminicola TaxID=1095026 RepID=UPI0007857503|nr:YlcI/YnfO family protein [Demequina sediminicola]
MELEHYVEDLQRQLVAASAAGTEETQQTAERLATALESATRMVILEALSEAAGEISHAIAPGAVDVRVRGRGVDFVVTGALSEADVTGSASDTATPEEAAAHAATVGAEPEAVEEEVSSRTTLRLPDALKQRAEASAAAEGISLNAWIVRAVQGAVTPAPQSRRGMASARYTGWVR